MTEASIPHYGWWPEIPDPDLVTQTTLSKEGLRLAPGQRHVATVSYGKRGKDTALLYRRSEARPKRQASEKQLAALAAAREKKERLHSDRFDRHIRASQRHTLKWARDLLQVPESFVILDTSTTSLEGEVIRITVLSGSGVALLDQRLCPLGEVDQDAQQIHGLGMEDLQDQPMFSEVWAQVQQTLRGKLIVAYNEDFDRDRLRYTRDLHGISREAFPFPRKRWDCLMTHASCILGDPEFDEYEQLIDFEYVSLWAARHQMASRLGEAEPDILRIRDSVVNARVALEVLQLLARQVDPQEPA
ncbi:exonuclease domain-containing protein [Deinococcus cellulosilyticus]|uniref:Exonuclease domain-containing protein n=1 Tax=Deinococcus cellulosilyticus (strain DSM 18568 / NBRC 106333 / KACC 11606 / 5516J-15) TaxID=1223518 RepID=A0A511NAI8_DEIC1|nr:exonuclease domain-containing protein [Deinococcus cellulosilyticus]GEM49844.1 hypothetical protein DC3_54790 [Deinococcus cellulosilyticus NBRC 106333 = KACC 11606]